MNKIDRATVKQQAKQIIKGRVFVLFIITFIVTFLTTNVSVLFERDTYNDLFNSFRGKDNGYSFGYNNGSDDEFDLDDFFEKNFGNEDGYYSDDENPIEGFSNQSLPVTPQSIRPSVSLLKSSASAFSLVSFFLSPLLVTLAGFYLALIRRNPQDELNLGFELKHLFKSSFNETYGNKLGVYFFKQLFTILLACLFIIPGIVFNYSAYFAFQIKCECPQLSPMECIRLSKKLTKGNRGELFVLNLSFIPWILLIPVTIGIASIYVFPYIMTTDALYYQNFKMRALIEGRVTEEDFKTQQQRANDFAQSQQYNQTQQGYGYQYAQNPQSNYNQPQSDNDYFYTPPKPENENYFTGYNPAPQPENYNTYYSQPEPQQENIYTPPTDNE